MTNIHVRFVFCLHMSSSPCWLIFTDNWVAGLPSWACSLFLVLMDCDDRPTWRLNWKQLWIHFEDNFPALDFGRHNAFKNLNRAKRSFMHGTPRGIGGGGKVYPWLALIPGIRRPSETRQTILWGLPSMKGFDIICMSNCYRQNRLQSLG